MRARTLTDRLDSPEALETQLRLLLKRDPRLRAVAKRAGPFAIRKTAPGFAGLARVVCGQQLSVQSAQAIWSRFEKLDGALAPDTYLHLSEAAVRASGFSKAKHGVLHILAQAILAGELDLDAVAALPSDEARAELVRHKGVGPWTAEIYLMFCAGHPDVFPAGDLALQKAVGHALGMQNHPSAKALTEIAAPWAPHRHAAALLFWRYYAAVLRPQGGVAL